MGPQFICWICTWSTKSFPMIEWESHSIIGNDMGLPARTWEPCGTPASWLGTYWDSHLAFGTPTSALGMGLDSQYTPNTRLGLPSQCWDRLVVPFHSQQNIGSPNSSSGLQLGSQYDSDCLFGIPELGEFSVFGLNFARLF